MRLYVTILIFSILMISVVNHAYAQLGTTGIIASTDKSSYQPGDRVTITGSVAKITVNNPVTIIVRNPIGNVYEVGQVFLSNNIFIHDFVLNNDASSGTYAVQIKHGTQTGKLTFVVNGNQIKSIQVEDFFIKVRGNDTNLIIYKIVSISTIDNSITMSVDMTAITSDSVKQEFLIPKAIIDAPGSSLILQTDGKILPCNQSETTLDRTLDCYIPANTKELKIIGTVVIPEFGTISVLILTIAIISIIFISSRLKIR